ncbi:MAG: SH3 domain-containing protein [Thermoanaerobacteraceae bacterium]|nr:SH3 domain-containing protein [Thermoanaerobacteraceae bacterium]
MRRLLRINVITVTILLLYILSLPAAFAQTATVTGSVVNVRSGPSVDNLKIGVVTEGYQLEVLEERNNWYKVRFAQDRVGWIYKELLQLNEDTGAKWIKITGSVVNVRSGPSTTYGVIDQVKNGERYPVTDKQGDWLKIRLDNKKYGWIAGWLAETTVPPGEADSQTAAGTGEEPIGVVVVGGSVVNVRLQPGLDSPVISRVVRGTRLTALGTVNGWYKVKLKDGRSGYLAGWLAELHRENPAEQLQGRNAKLTHVKVNGSVVNVRQAPELGSPVVAQVRQGEKYAVVDRKGNWVLIKLDGQQGYIASWLVDLIYSTDYQEESEPAAGAPTDNSPDAGKYVKREDIAVIDGSVVNVRSGPGIGNSRIAQVREGEKYPLLKKENGWYQIRLSDGKTGWIAGWLAKETTRAVYTGPDGDTEQGSSGNTGTGQGDGKTAAGKEKLFVVKHDMPLYYGPDRRFPKVTTIAEGDTVLLLAEKGDWYEVRLDNGITGWLERRSVADRGSVDRTAQEQDTGKEIIATDGVYEVSVTDDGEELVIALKANSVINYDLMQLQDPLRLVIDLHGQTLAVPEPQREMLVGSEVVKRIRLGQFEQDTVRVVLDLKSNVQYDLASANDGKTLLVTVNPPNLAGKVIVIDPGHGSITPWGKSDPGAIGFNGTRERDVVLAISRKLASMLQRTGAEVIMTRNGDATLSLEDRAWIANRNNADVFLSIHANSSPSRLQRGSATYFYAPYGSALAGQRGKRYRLARLIQDELVSAAGTTDLGVKEENFSVLRNTNVPSVLVETAFISHPEEEMLLRNPQFQEKVARGIARGVERYLLGN